MIVMIPCNKCLTLAICLNRFKEVLNKVDAYNYNEQLEQFETLLPLAEKCSLLVEYVCNEDYPSLIVPERREDIFYFFYQKVYNMEN